MDNDNVCTYLFMMCESEQGDLLLMLWLHRLDAWHVLLTRVEMCGTNSFFLV